MKVNIVEHKTKEYIDTPSELGQRLLNAVSQLSYLDSCFSGTAEAFLIENRRIDGIVAFAIADKEVLDAEYFSSDVKDYDFGVIVLPNPQEYFVVVSKANGTKEQFIEFVKAMETQFSDKRISYDIFRNNPEDIMLQELMPMGYVPQEIGYIYSGIETDIKDGKFSDEEAETIKSSLGFYFTPESWDTIFDYEANEYTIKWADIKDKPNALNIIRYRLDKLGKDF